MIQKSRGIAIAFMLAGSLFLAFQSYFARKLIVVYDIETVLAARFIVGFLLICGYLIFLHRPLTFLHKYVKISSWKLSILSGLCGVCSVGCYFWSIQFLPFSVATSLFLSFPLLLPYFWKLKTQGKISAKVIYGMIIMCVGIALIIINNIMGVVALISGMLLLVWMSLVQRLHAQENSLNIAFHYFFIAALCSFGFFVSCKGLHAFHLSSIERYSLLGFGCISLLCQLFFTLSLRYAAAWVVTPFIYSSVVFSWIFDKLWIKTPLGLGNQLGSFLVIVGGVWIMRVLFKGTCGNL